MSFSHVPHPKSTIQQYMDSTSSVCLYGQDIPELDKYRMLYPKVVPGGFLNLSGLFIPLEVEILLSFGPNYSPLTPPDISTYMVAIKNYSDGYLENGVDLRMYNREDLEQHYSCFVSAMLKYQHQTLYHRMLTHLFQVTLSFLKKHNDLIIVQADKGNTSLLIPRMNYINKVQIWLDAYVSSGACVVFTGDRSMLLRRLTALYRKLALPLCRLHVSNPTLFPRPIYLELHNKRNSPPEISYLYGNLKIHKDGCPIRPICSPVDWLISPIHKLCGLFLKRVLDERLSKNNLDNMDHLTGHILNLVPIPGYVFITLDVKEMYPKTQLEPLWAILQDLMAREWFRDNCPVEIDLLNRMLKFILYQANYFSFNTNWYQQIEGLPQGGSASGYLARIFLDSRLEVYRSLIFTAHQVKIWWKYVDDLLVYLPEESISEFVSSFSRWTGYEVSHDKEVLSEKFHGCPTISYLDYNIIRTSDRFLISLYLKPSNSQRILHYTSHSAMTSKRNAVLYHLRRVLYRSSDKYLVSDMFSCVSMIMLNGYPHHYVMSQLSGLVHGYSSKRSCNIQPYTNIRHILLSKILGISGIKNYPSLLTRSPNPRIYLHSTVYSCEEVSNLLRSAYSTQGVPTFSSPDTLFLRLGMSLRDAHTTTKISKRSRILLTFCATCNLGFVCTGKGSRLQILNGIKTDISSPIQQHFINTGHSGLSATMELQHAKGLSQLEQILLYRHVYLSMGVHLDENYNYGALSRFLVLGLDNYIRRIPTNLPLPHKRKHGSIQN